MERVLHDVLAEQTPPAEETQKSIAGSSGTAALEEEGGGGQRGGEMGKLKGKGEGKGKGYVLHTLQLQGEHNAMWEQGTEVVKAVQEALRLLLDAAT